jgi:hypothetical protein
MLRGNGAAAAPAAAAAAANSVSEAELQRVREKHLTETKLSALQRQMQSSEKIWQLTRTVAAQFESGPAVALNALIELQKL